MAVSGVVVIFEGGAGMGDGFRAERGDRRVRGGMMGSHNCRIVGKPQPVLILIRHINPLRTRTGVECAEAPPACAPGRLSSPSPLRACVRGGAA
eukprot:COSAG01_NODE_3993_length_5456_cov_28.008774_3_plen_94_part_00